MIRISNLKISVVGIYHLGLVTASCLAEKGHQVKAMDFDKELIASINEGILPIEEKQIPELIKSGLDSGNLEFSSNIKEDIGKEDLIWITYDTPVNSNDEADINYVVENI